MTLILVSPKLGGRFPRQVQRSIPLSLLVLLGLFILYGPPSWIPSQAAPDVLMHAFSQQSPSPSLFPKKFWQIWKTPPLHFEKKELSRARNWTDFNPTYRYEVLTDDNALPWVEQAYGPAGLKRPDVVNFYRIFQDHIIKADLLRYLIMYVDGGTYADIDVSALKPIDNFIPDPFKGRESDIDMVVGVEIDQPQYKDHPILGSKSMSFVQWTFMCKPRLPVMLKLINEIILYITALAEAQHVPISKVTMNFDQVITGSGPTAFTLAILSEMSKKQGKLVPWSTFHNITEPKLVGGVLVLPVKAFAAGQGHSNSGSPYCPEANIKHHYHASKWPLTHPRYQHPIYGQLEDCSWDEACIKEWEKNIALWKKLDPKIQEKELLRRKQGHAERLAREAREELEMKADAEKEAKKTVADLCAVKFAGTPPEQMIDAQIQKALDGQPLDVSRPRPDIQVHKKKFRHSGEIESAQLAEEEADAALLKEWGHQMRKQREERRKEREAELAVDNANKPPAS